MARLGELLVAQGLATAEHVEEALEVQVIHGGRLGTNLVELGFLKESDLAATLGRMHNLPYALGEMIPDPAALAVGDSRFFDDNEVLPMRLDATRLTVAILHPNQHEALDALGFRAGKRVVSVVVPEFRMNQLLRKHCRAFRALRPIDMNSLRPSKREGDDAHKPLSGDELMNEEDFARIYANAVGGRTAEPQAGEEEVIEGVVLEDGAAPEAHVPTPAAPEALESLSFAQAQALLQKSSDREDIAQTVLRFAKSTFRRVVLLNIRGDMATGWTGMGHGIQLRSVQRIGVSLREGNTLRLVRDLRSHFVGPMKRTPGMEVFYQLLGGGFPTTAVLMPLLVRGKPVHLLYVDQGPDQLTAPNVGELLIVSQGVTRSYEALIRQRQARKSSVSGLTPILTPIPR